MTTQAPRSKTSPGDSSSWRAIILRPGWIFFIIFIVFFTWLSFAVLAPWQLNKDDDIVARNEKIQAAYERDPVPYNEVLDSSGGFGPDAEWSRVVIRGEYLTDDEVLLRLRPAGSGPSYQSLVPFKTTDGATLLINRGWKEAGEANTVPEIEPAPEGEQLIVGMVRESERVRQTEPITDDGYLQVYSINPKQIGELTGNTLGDSYIQLSEDQPGVLNPLPVPKLDRGNHLSYGLQWLALGVMAPIGMGYFIWSEIRERRRVSREEAEMRGEQTTDSAPQAPGLHSEGEDVEPADNHNAHAAEPDAEADLTRAQAEAQSRRRRSRYGTAKPDYYAKYSKRERERF